MRKMNKVLSFALSAAMVISMASGVPASAAEAKDDQGVSIETPDEVSEDIVIEEVTEVTETAPITAALYGNKFSIDENGVLTIGLDPNQGGGGRIASLPSAISNSTIKEIVIEDGIRVLDSSVFAGRKTLTKVTLSSTCKTVGGSVFSSDDALESINLENVETIGEYAFFNCSSLKEVNLKAEEISNYAFYGCSGLTKVTLADSVKTLGKLSFQGCNNLESINLENVETISGGALNYCNKIKELDFSSVKTYETNTLPNALETIVFGDSFEEIPASMCQTKENLKSVTLSPNVKTIGAFAFSNCPNLETINLENVTTIGRSAFYGNSKLTSIDIRNVETISDSAFAACSSLKNVRMDNVIEIGEMTFQRTGLESIVIPNSTVTIGLGAFSANKSLVSVELGDNVETIGKSAFAFCSKLESITIPDKVKVIDEETFTYDENLQYVDLGQVESISREAFYYCPVLATVIVPDTLSEIGEEAFAYEYALESINLNKVKSVGKKAFYASNKLKTVKATSVESIGEEAFSWCSDLRSIEFSDALTTLAAWPFWKCDKLDGLYIPASATDLNKNAFVGAPYVAGAPGSKAEELALNSDVPYIPVDENTDGFVKAINGDNYYYFNGTKMDATKDGAVVIDGEVYFACYGQIDKNSVIIYETEDGEIVFVANGKAQGLVGDDSEYLYIDKKNDNQAYMVKNGELSKVTTTGLIKDPNAEIGTLYYVVDGQQDEKFNGAVVDPDSDKTYFVKKGVAKEDLNGNYQGNDDIWYTVVAGEATIAEDGAADAADGSKRVVIKDGKADESVNGFIPVDGSSTQSYYYENGVCDLKANDTSYDKTTGKILVIVGGICDTNYSGMVECNGYTVIVKNGEIDNRADGIYQLADGKSYCFIGGSCYFCYEGIYEALDGKTYFLNRNAVDVESTKIESYIDYFDVEHRYYVVKGVVQTDFTGAIGVDGQYVNVTNGEVTGNFTGMYKDGTSYYCIHDGKREGSCSKCNGLQAYKDGTKLYMKNGVSMNSYSGLFKSTDGKLYYVTKGVFQKSKNTTSKFSGDGKYYVVKNGVATGLFTGAVCISSKYYYVKSGVRNNSFTGIAKHSSGTYYYLKKGVGQPKFTGFAKHTNGKWYYTKKGVVQMSSTGLAKHTNGKTYYYKKGIWQTSFTGFVKKSGKYYYVKKGIWQNKYTGTVKISGKKYKVRKGIRK